MTVTIQDVEKAQSKEWQALGEDKKEYWLQFAENLIENQFSQRFATLPTIRGDPDDAHILLTAHCWEVATGGQVNSESQQGSSADYNTVTGEWNEWLSETSYGRAFRDQFLSDRRSVGVVRRW